MQVERNSVWQVTGIDGIRDDTYRVLEHDAKNDLLILFRQHDGNGLEKPGPVELSIVLEAAKCS